MRTGLWFSIRLGLAVVAAATSLFACGSQQIPSVTMESVVNGNATGLVRIVGAQLLDCREHKIEGKVAPECFIGYVSPEGTPHGLFVDFAKAPPFTSGDWQAFLEFAKNYTGPVDVEGSVADNRIVASAAYVDGQKYDLRR